MDNTCDYPAAHSMDTTWFAVDQDGHVGIFESGENGAVPKQFEMSQDSGYEAVNLLWKLVKVGVLEFDWEIIKSNTEEPHVKPLPNKQSAIQINKFVANYAPLPQRLLSLLSFGLYHPLLRTKTIPIPFPLQHSGTHIDLVVEINSWQALLDLQLSAKFHRLQTLDQSVVVLFDELKQADYDKLHQNAVCQFCSEVRYHQRFHAAIGCHCYDGDYEWYKQVGIPQEPVQLSELQSNLPEEVSLLHLPYKFAELTDYQPIETMECVTWGDMPYYFAPGLTSKGHIKSVPGKQTEYRRWYQEEYSLHRDDWYQGIHAEPPAS